MLNLPQQTIDRIKKLLLHQKREVEDHLETLDKDDPVFDNTAEAEESGTASWEADVHSRISTLKNDLLGFSKRISGSLLSLRKGTYGKCENCGQVIESARLEVLPTATLCLACSKKPAKRKRQ